MKSTSGIVEAKLEFDPSWNHIAAKRKPLLLIKEITIGCITLLQCEKITVEIRNNGNFTRLSFILQLRLTSPT